MQHGNELTNNSTDTEIFMLVKGLLEECYHLYTKKS